MILYYILFFSTFESPILNLRTTRDKSEHVVI